MNPGLSIPKPNYIPSKNPGLQIQDSTAKFNFSEFPSSFQAYLPSYLLVTTNRDLPVFFKVFSSKQNFIFKFLFIVFEKNESSIFFSLSLFSDKILDRVREEEVEREYSFSRLCAILHKKFSTSWICFLLHLIRFTKCRESLVWEKNYFPLLSNFIGVFFSEC